MTLSRKQVGGRRGSVLVLAVFSLVFVGGVAAIAIDLSMLYKARNDAQRAAEAGALAGASAFVDYTAFDSRAVDSANVRAERLARANSILNQPVAVAEVEGIEIFPELQKVRVVVGRQQIGTWFARLLGVTSVPVKARAAAVAMSAGTGNCVKPFAVPDAWNEATDDANGNELEDNEEQWTSSDDDDYLPGDPNDPTTGQTGYGSGLRNPNGDYRNDYGRAVALRLPDAASPTPYFGPNQFLPFLPSGGNDPNDYQDAIEDCDPSQVNLGDSYRLMSDPSALSGQTNAGIQSLINDDPGAHWNSQTQTIDDSRFADWRSSPRTIRIGLFDPEQLGPTQTSVQFNNLGLMFVEGFDPATNQLFGRIFYFALGTGNPTAGAGSLVKALRLVE